MMRIVHLARHGSHSEVGHVLSGRSEIALSTTGRDEAAQLAHRLADVPLRAVYASPRRRTQETAEIVAARHDLIVRTSDALDEIDFGDWTGRAFADLDHDPRWHAWNAHRGSGRAPGGETMADAIARARAFLDRIEEREILCVSHCDIIRGVVASCLGLDPDRILSFDCDPASLTTLAFDQGEVRLLTLNERPTFPRSS